MIRSSPKISTGEDHERPDVRSTELLKEDQWVAEFIKRLNNTIEDIGRKK